MKRVVYVFRVFVLSEMIKRMCCVKGCGKVLKGVLIRVMNMNIMNMFDGGRK